jgi:hypothetical protein
VTQKSYGSEKRFFCPQPKLITFGYSSDFNELHSCTISSCNKTNIHIGGNNELSKSSKKKYQAENMSGLNSGDGIPFVFNREYLPIDRLSSSSSNPRSHMSCQTINFKDLYVNKSLCGDLKLTLKMQRNFLKISSLQSTSIKVISKPSKKLTCKIEMGVKSGDMISLFNRIRSQAVSTRFLGINENGMVGKAQGDWDLWRIWSWEDSVEITGKHMRYEGYLLQIDSVFPKTLCKDRYGQLIRYGETVVLEHVMTGVCTTPLIIRAIINRNSVAISNMNVENIPIDAGQFFSSIHCLGQFHKVAFQIAEFSSNFLKLRLIIHHFSVDNLVVVEQTSENRMFNGENPGDFYETIDELCAFSVVGIGILLINILEIVETSFYKFPSSTNLENDLVLLPSILVIRHKSKRSLVITGFHFTQKMWVFIGNYPATNIVILSSERIVVELNSIFTLCDNADKGLNVVTMALLCILFIIFIVTVGCIVIKSGFSVYVST